jgi:hypothetical protein
MNSRVEIVVNIGQEFVRKRRQELALQWTPIVISELREPEAGENESTDLTDLQLSPPSS